MQSAPAIFRMAPQELIALGCVRAVRSSTQQVKKPFFRVLTLKPSMPPKSNRCCGGWQLVNVFYNSHGQVITALRCTHLLIPSPAVCHKTLITTGIGESHGNSIPLGRKGRMVKPVILPLQSLRPHPYMYPHTLPVGSPLELTSTGGQPVPRVHLASTPSCTNPSTRSRIGRSRMRATPSSTNLVRGVRRRGRCESRAGER